MNDNHVCISAVHYRKHSSLSLQEKMSSCTLLVALFSLPLAVGKCLIKILAPFSAQTPAVELI